MEGLVAVVLAWARLGKVGDTMASTESRSQLALLVKRTWGVIASNGTSCARPGQR